MSLNSNETQEHANEFNEIIILLLHEIYGKENLTSPTKVGLHQYLASRGRLLFDVVSSPPYINVDKINAALTNNYITEIIYLVPDRVITNHAKVTYKNIAEYVKILQYKNKTDLVRLVNQFRNKAEEAHERTKRAQS